MSYIRSCELSEDVIYQRIWNVKRCKLPENVTCQRMWTTVTEDMNCQFMRTVRGCELSKENCQRISHIRYELLNDVTYQIIWTVREYKQSENVTGQRMSTIIGYELWGIWTVRGCQLSDNMTCQMMWTVKGCELSEDVNYQRMWIDREYKLLEDVKCQRTWTVNVCKLSEDVNCYKGCELSEDLNCQYM